jgi:hypothetical protein
MPSIINSDDGVVSGTSGLKTTGGNDGITTFQQNGTEQMRITATGNVGIGTSSPVYQLHTVGNTDGNITNGVTNSSAGASAVSRFIALSDAGSAVFGMTSSAYTGITGAQDAMLLNAGNASGGIAFALDGVLKAKIDSGGNLLVGTTTSQGRFTVTATGSTTIDCARTETTLSNNIILRNGNGAVGSIQTNGSTTAYNTSSDYRLKENVQPMSNALAKVAALKPVTYTWKVDGSAGEGFIAHELAEIVPQCVGGDKDAVDADGNPVYQGVDTSFLVATLTKAIQEQQQMIETLQAKVAALEAK